MSRLDAVVVWDGIAIFLIVAFHAMGGYPNNPLYWLNQYLVFIGLSLFTFSAGFKLGYNHLQELGDRKFLLKYYAKRFIRLYKPYLGYSALVILPLLLISYISIHVFHLSFAGLTIKFPNIGLFLLGSNPVAPQLWYLVALLGIITIDFILLYLGRLKAVSLSLIVFLPVAILIKLHIIVLPDMVAWLLLYLPFYSLGCLYAYFQSIHPKWKPSFNISRVKVLSPFLHMCGRYSFQIYLLQYPIILSVLTRLIIDIAGLNLTIVPFIIAIIAMYLCVFVYLLLRKIHLNVLFE